MRWPWQAKPIRYKMSVQEMQERLLLSRKSARLTLEGGVTIEFDRIPQPQNRKIATAIGVLMSHGHARCYITQPSKKDSGV